jgi:hypothetical protein
MRRRSRASSKVANARSRKAKTLETVRHSSSSASGEETEVARLTRERDEALEQLSEALKQQTAASEVLRLISGSPGELGAVFDAMLVNATKLCEARFGILLLWEEDAFRTVALHNARPAFVEHRRREPVIRYFVSPLQQVELQLIESDVALRLSDLPLSLADDESDKACNDSPEDCSDGAGEVFEDLISSTAFKSRAGIHAGLACPWLNEEA